MTCPTGSINAFPLQLSLTATDTLYDTVSEPLTMDFQWASRSTPPLFVNPKTSGITDEVGSGNSNLSTLRFMNLTYTVSAVQIITASHKGWVLPITSQQNNTEDLVITFSNSTATHPYIAFVIPILRSTQQVNPGYLQGLSDPNANGPFSLSSCFPVNPRARFVYYSICMNGSTATAPTQKMYVFVSTDGIQVAQTLMTALMAVSGNKTQFSTYSPPPSVRFSTTTKMISSVADFSTYVQTSTQLLNFTDFKNYYPDNKVSALDAPDHDANSYQCVAVDPDSAIVDGRIQIDLSTGELLPEVLSKRDSLRAAHSVKGGMDPGRFEKYMGTALGVILSIVFFGVILWLIVFNLMELGNEAGVYTWLTLIPSYLLPALLMGFIGFIIGAMLN